MKYYLRVHSILGEKIQTLLMTIFIFSMLVLTIVLSIIYKNIALYLAVFMLFPVAVYFTYASISIFRNTIDYKVFFYDTYFHIKSKKYDFTIDYSRITSMALKRNYSIMSSVNWLYLEIECGLIAPVYIHFSFVQATKLSDITNVNFVKHYEKILKWTRIVERRNKNNII